MGAEMYTRHQGDHHYESLNKGSSNYEMKCGVLSDGVMKLSPSSNLVIDYATEAGV